MRKEEVTQLNNVKLLRVIAMLFIFSYHIVLGIYLNMKDSDCFFPLYFGVQIFLFLSGYLYSKKKIEDKKKFIVKRFVTILIPYYIFLFVLFVVYIFINPTAVSFEVIIKSIFCIQFYPEISSIGHFWYLFYALICYLMILVLIFYRDNKANLTKSKKILCKMVIVFFVVVDIISVVVANSHVCFTCVIIGFMYGNFDKNLQNKNLYITDLKKWRKTIGLILALICSSTIYFLLNNKKSIDLIPVISNLLSRFSVVGIAISFSILILSLFSFMNRKKLNFLIEFLSNKSYCFYITHHIFCIGIFNLLSVTQYLWLNILIILVVSCISATALDYVSKKVIKFLKPKEKMQ